MKSPAKAESESSMVFGGRCRPPPRVYKPAGRDGGRTPQQVTPERPGTRRHPRKPRARRIADAYIDGYTQKTTEYDGGAVRRVKETLTMQSAWSARVAVSAVLLTSALALSHESSVKLRRDGVLNLYPFPRVGRSPHRTWEVPLNDLYLDYKSAQKRQLYAFPRVGRGGVLYQLPEKYLLPDNRYQLRGPEEPSLPDHRGRGYAKRESESTDKTSMWFGPRLGRSQKDFEIETDSVQPAAREHAEPDLELYEIERKKRQAK